VWKESSPDEDCKLVARCQEGDPLAFEELVRKYQQSILNLVYHYVGHKNDIEDIAQKIFIKIYYSLPKFDLQRPFFPWLYRIALNQCYDELRHTKRQRTYTFSELSLEDAASIEKLINQSEAHTPPEENQEMHILLHKVLAQLSEPQRRVIIFRDIEAISYAEMAKILKCSEQAARLKVFRARNRLKTVLEKALDKRRQEAECSRQKEKPR
jgi:RNA polymerase sigma-70 factor (ECF subfamily)